MRPVCILRERSPHTFCAEGENDFFRLLEVFKRQHLDDDLNPEMESGAPVFVCMRQHM